METIHKQFLDALMEAEKARRGAEQVIVVTIPIVKDDKLLLRALEGIHKSMVLSISTILKIEHLYNRIDLASSPEKNLETFFRIAWRYGLNSDIDMIKEALFLGKKHKESGLEFVKKG